MSSNPANLLNMDNVMLPGSQSIYEESTTKQQRYGAKIRVGDTIFAYCKAGTNQVAGNLITAAPVSTECNKATVGAAVVAGTYEVPVYIVTNQTANYFADAYLVCQDSGGEGITYRIKSHGALTATTVGQKVTLYDPVASGGDMTTATKVSVIRNPYNGVLSSTDITATSPIWGVAPISVTSGNYFWAAVQGPIGVHLGNAAAVYGAKLAAGTTGYALAIDATANATAYVGIVIGYSGTAYDTVLTAISVDKGL